MIMNSHNPYSIYWLRADMRIEDNPALLEACKQGLPVLALYINEVFEGPFGTLGSASKVWLHHSLIDLKKELLTLGIPLVVIQGHPIDIWNTLSKDPLLKNVYWNRRYDPNGLKADTCIKASLRNQGIAVASYPGNILFEPHAMQTQQGGPFQVFTPFWKHCLKKEFPLPCEEVVPVSPLSASQVAIIESSIQGTTHIDRLELLPKIPWHGTIEDHWEISRQGALKTLEIFIHKNLLAYADGRDFPAQRKTSSLSPYLRWGQISPREIIAKIRKANSWENPHAQKFVAEIGWREFAYHLLWHFPETPTQPLRPQYAAFPFEPINVKWLKAWQTGQTGYPLIDAGMRELWQTGAMHNRVRMVAASFWVKHLLQPWQAGSEWFWDTLVDADLASNTLGWQWVAGCGADAAPYFRVFNPVTQGTKHDKEGRYTLSYVPELRKISTQYLHAPWEAPTSYLNAIDIQFGDTYPLPLILPDEGRKKALEAYANFRASSNQKDG